MEVRELAAHVVGGSAAWRDEENQHVAGMLALPLIKKIHLLDSSSPSRQSHVEVVAHCTAINLLYLRSSLGFLSQLLVGRARNETWTGGPPACLPPGCNHCSKAASPCLLWPAMTCWRYPSVSQVGCLASWRSNHALLPRDGHRPGWRWGEFEVQGLCYKPSCRLVMTCCCCHP